MKAQELRQLIREEIRNTIKEQQLNEDLALVGDIALGVAGGLVGLWALVKGGGAVLRGLGDTAEALSMAMEEKAKVAARKAKEEGRANTLKPIIAKFENDTMLKDMYKNLPPYKAMKNNSERTKQLNAIAKYIKSKLNADEMTYFTDISAKLRGGEGQ